MVIYFDAVAMKNFKLVILLKEQNLQSKNISSFSDSKHSKLVLAVIVYSCHNGCENPSCCGALKVHMRLSIVLCTYEAI